MDRLKQWVALTLVGALAIVAAGWFLLVGPKRGEAGELRTQAADQQSANAMLQTQIEVLKAKARDLPKEQARLGKVSAKIPESPALPALVRALLGASTDAGVELVSITPGAPVVAAAAAPTPANGQASPGTAPVSSSFGQLASIPVAINVVGEYFKVATFLKELESLPRALWVNNVSLVPGAAPTDTTPDPAALAQGRSLTTTISGFVYMAAEGSAAASVPSVTPPSAANPATDSPS